MKAQIVKIAKAENSENKTTYVEYTVKGRFAGRSIVLDVTSFDVDDLNLKCGDSVNIELTIDRISVGFESLTVVKEILL